jgi:ATP-binding cassette, subfamily C (CFTR/MRP), member 1
VYAHYLMSIGLLLTIATLLLNVLYQAFSIGTNVWLSIWSNEQSKLNVSLPASERDMYLGVYGGLGLGQGKKRYNFISISLIYFQFKITRHLKLHENQLGL